MFFSGFSASSGRVRFHSVEAMAARWPPAEKPMTPMRRGSIPREEAFFRTILRAWRASSRGPGNFPMALLVPETRYFTTTPTMPCSAAQPAMRLPSFSMAWMAYPLPENTQGRAPVLRTPSGGKVKLDLRFPYVRNMSGGGLFSFRSAALSPREIHSE